MSIEENEFSELISIIIESALTVHKLFGSGFPKELYKRALEIELNLRELKFTTDFKAPVFYKGQQIGTRGIDLLIEGHVSVELKANKLLEDQDCIQLVNYIEDNNLEIGLIINFGSVSLDYKRIVNTKISQSEIEKLD